MGHYYYVNDHAPLVMDLAQNKRLSGGGGGVNQSDNFATLD